MSSPYDRQVGGDHYRSMPIQPARFIIANNLPWAEGCVIKYVCRWMLKGGAEDLRKAQHLLEMLIAEAESDAHPETASEIEPSVCSTRGWRPSTFEGFGFSGGGGK